MTFDDWMRERITTPTSREVWNAAIQAAAEQCSDLAQGENTPSYRYGAEWCKVRVLALLDEV
jgi:hypothetical protein